ncbi:MAG: hypothetical protein LC620_02615, partial [Halobacteriales archaeon]|nr:hypothetical protein [Halobacteriales archaeon]
MVADGIVLDANENRIDELNAKSLFGGSRAELVLTDRRVHVRTQEFLGPKKQRTFDLRNVQS